MIARRAVFALKKAKKSTIGIPKNTMSKFRDFGVLKAKKLNTKFKQMA